mmetsp:Transcript_4326/g.6656  ORF Transcript_4326/g.6656 Transcript_4326/m.6656 type:complete len:378 (-) Transcript_4326:288-1421(-)
MVLSFIIHPLLSSGLGATRAGLSFSSCSSLSSFQSNGRAKSNVNCRPFQCEAKFFPRFRLEFRSKRNGDLSRSATFHNGLEFRASANEPGTGSGALKDLVLNDANRLMADKEELRRLSQVNHVQEKARMMLGNMLVNRSTIELAMKNHAAVSLTGVSKAAVTSEMMDETHRVVAQKGSLRRGGVWVNLEAFMLKLKLVWALAKDRKYSTVLHSVAACAMVVIEETVSMSSAGAGGATALHYHTVTSSTSGSYSVGGFLGVLLSLLFLFVFGRLLLLAGWAVLIWMQLVVALMLLAVGLLLPFAVIAGAFAAVTTAFAAITAVMFEAFFSVLGAFAGVLAVAVAMITDWRVMLLLAGGSILLLLVRWTTSMTKRRRKY